MSGRCSRSGSGGRWWRVRRWRRCAPAARLEWAANGHPALFADHGIVHVRDIAAGVVELAATVEGVLLPVRPGGPPRVRGRARGPAHVRARRRHARPDPRRPPDPRAVRRPRPVRGRDGRRARPPRRRRRRRRPAHRRRERRRAVQRRPRRRPAGARLARGRPQQVDRSGSLARRTHRPAHGDAARRAHRPRAPPGLSGDADARRHAGRARRQRPVVLRPGPRCLRLARLAPCRAPRTGRRRDRRRAPAACRRRAPSAGHDAPHRRRLRDLRRRRLRRSGVRAPDRGQRPAPAPARRQPDERGRGEPPVRVRDAARQPAHRVPPRPVQLAHGGVCRLRGDRPGRRRHRRRRARGVRVPAFLLRPAGAAPRPGIDGGPARTPRGRAFVRRRCRRGARPPRPVARGAGRGRRRSRGCGAGRARSLSPRDRRAGRQ